MRRFVAAFMAAVLGAALLAACGGKDEEPAVRPVAEPEPLQVVALGDSNVAGWGLPGADGARYSPEDAYPYRYADLLADELGVEVRARSHFPNQLGNEIRTVAEWAETLQTDEAMAADVARADVVVVLVGFHDLVPALLYGRCPGTWPAMEPCVREVTSAMPAGFDAFYGRIAELTGGDATVLVADYGIPPAFWDRWGDDPHWAEIQRVIFEDWRTMLVAAADDHGFVVVPTSRELNDPGGRPVEDLTSDGFHFAAAGHERMARIHLDHDGITATATCPPDDGANRADARDGERPASAGPEAAVAVDRARGRRLALDWAHDDDGWAATWSFDLCTNAWTALHPDVEPSVGGIARLVFDEDSDVAVAFGHATPTTPWVYEPDANTWTPLPRDPSAPDLELLRPRDFAYDPRAGDIVLHDSWTGGLWAFDVDTNTWSELPQGEVVPTEHDTHSLLTYDRRAGRLVLVAIGRETWRYSRVAGTWQRGGTPSPELNTGYFETGGEITFDEGIGRVVVYSDTTLATYDTVEDRWRTVEAPDGVADFETGERARLGHAFVHDPVNGRDVLLLGQARLVEGWRAARSVWAFDHADGAWTELAPG